MDDIISFGMKFCFVVGPIQLIGSVIRDIRIKDKSTQYAQGIASYHKAVGIFWLTFVVGIIIQNVFIDIEKYLYILIPGVASILALYYWLIIFTYSRKSQNAN